MNVLDEQQGSQLQIQHENKHTAKRSHKYEKIKMESKKTHKNNNGPDIIIHKNPSKKHD